MVTGVMSKNRTAGLYFLPSGMTMNGSRHVSLLREECNCIWRFIKLLL